MGRLVQSTHGAGFQMTRKKLWFCLWFIVSGIITDIHCISGINKNSRTFDKASNYSLSDVFKNQTLSKESSDGSSTLQNPSSQTFSSREGRAVPPRIKFPKQDDTDYKEFLNDEVLGYVRKIPIHVLELQSMKSKMVPRPGRAETDDTNSGYAALSGVSNLDESDKKRNTVIPTMRFGRQNAKAFAFYDDQNYDNGYVFSKRSSESFPLTENEKRTEPSNIVIPYPRFGQSYDDVPEKAGDYDGAIMDGIPVDEDKNFVGVNDNSIDHQLKPEHLYSNARVKRQTLDYVLPQIRYGRSMILLSTSKVDKATTEKPRNFVLPYPRPGRSSKYSNVMLPYPRPGRSKKPTYKDLLNLINTEKRQGYMLPSARLGRSNIKTGFENNDVMNMDEGFLGLKVNPLFLKSAPEKSKDTGESSPLFVIPYPRPGKKSLSKMHGSTKNQRMNNRENKNIADYVLPYPRPGKKSYNEISTGKLNNAKNSKSNTENFIFPYPRPGRAREESFKIVSDGESSENRPDKGTFDEEEKFDDELENSNTKTQNVYLNLLKKSERNFMIPYARLGRDYKESSEEDSFDSDSNDIYKFSKEQEYDFDLYDSDPYSSQLEDNDLSLSRFKRSNSVVPYPRLGRSDSVVPYPRLGRSNSVVPYPRMGRSNSVTPYSRLSKSTAIVPYPRPGRSNSVVPYPRLGKSVTVVPYPRPGRSNTLVPYPRFGKSVTVVPYPRTGRSNTLVPYPRFGRSEPAANHEVSYSVIPYPRPGRSNPAFPVLRQRRSKSLSMYSKQRLPNDGEPVISSELSNQRPNYLLPNIRPGRYSGEGDTYILPYPRPGRSTKNGQGYVLPHPRIGRSDENTVNENETSYGNTVIPYPRLGRSQKQVTPAPEIFSNSVHKLNKHMLAVDDSIYLLPYPRPGRHTE